MTKSVQSRPTYSLRRYFVRGTVQLVLAASLMVAVSCDIPDQTAAVAQGEPAAPPKPALPLLPPIDEAKVQERRDAIEAYEPEVLVHWTFDSPYVFGVYEHDRSGNSIDGRTVWNGQRSAGGVYWKPGEGHYGGAGYIPDSSRGSMTARDTMELPASWTLSMWYKPSADRPDSVGSLNIAYFTNPNDGTIRFSLGQRGRWGVNVYNEEGAQVGGTGMSKPARKAGAWHHLAVVVDNNQMHMFVNGVKSERPGTISTPITGPVRLGIAGIKGAPHHKPGGHYDELRLIGRALSDDEIAVLADKDNEAYQALKAPIADAGIGYTARMRDGRAVFAMQGRDAFGQTDIQYLWELTRQPKGTRARFADPLDPETTFHTDSAGDYAFRLSAIGPGGVDQAEVKGVVFAALPEQGNPKLFSYGDGRTLRPFGYEAPHPARAERLEGEELPVVAHWSLDTFENGTIRGTGPVNVSVDPKLKAVFTAEGRHGGALDLREAWKPRIDFGTFPELIDEYSLSFWVYNEKQLNGGELVRVEGDDGNEYWKLWYRHNKNAASTDSILYYKWYQATGLIPTSEWVHIVATFAKNGNVCKLYVNGQQHAWIKRPLEEATGTPRIFFGTPAILDDITLYSTTLNSEEVLALYRSEGDASTVPERIPADPYQTAAYSKELMDRYFADPEPDLIREGFAVERFGRERLPTGVHPRLNFTLEDLPRIRRMSRLNEFGVYNYAFVTLYPASPFGWDQERYSHNARVVKDEKTGKDKIEFDNGQGASSRICLAYIALLDADTRLARILIDGMMEEARLQRKVLDERLPVRNDWREGYHDVLGRRVTPQMYDYLYNWMTEEERGVIRKVIADATADKYSVGMYGVPAHNAHISNWQPWITGELFVACESIYGEAGFDPQTHQAAGRALALCASNMNGPEDGAHFEGMGKSNIGISQMSILARNQAADEKIVASGALYNHVTKFLLHTGLPWDHARYMTDEKLGGIKAVSGAAVNVLHYAYPDDPVINYLKRLQTEEPEKRANCNMRAFGQESWLYTAPYLEDWKGPQDLTEHLRQATQNEPFGYISHFRGQMISRNAWDADAVQLVFMPRVIRGGHWQPCRGYFRVNAFGREWFTFRSFASHEKAGWIPARNSIVTVDGDGQDVTTARMLHYEGAAEKSDAVFDVCTADLTGSYRHSDDAWATMNATRFKPDERAWFDAPKGLLPASLNAFQPARSGPMTVEGIDLETVPQGQRPFEYAYRTAVFARGEHPYILIIDDFKKDDQIREYTWNAALPKDLMVPEAHRIQGDRALITDPAHPSRRLFVQMLSHEGKGAFTLAPAYSRHEKKNTDLINLCFKSRSAGKRFYTLIYPHREGAPQPKVEVSGDRYRIAIGNQVDELTVSRDATGRQQVRVRRR